MELLHTIHLSDFDRSLVCPCVSGRTESAIRRCRLLCEERADCCAGTNILESIALMVGVRSDDALVVVATGSQSTFGRNKLRTSRAMYDGEGEV